MILPEFVAPVPLFTPGMKKTVWRASTVVPFCRSIQAVEEILKVHQERGRGRAALIVMALLLQDRMFEDLFGDW